MSMIAYLSIIASHLCFIIMFWVVGDLSRILGLALKKKPVYKFMYLGSVFLVLGMCLCLLGNSFNVYAIILDIIGVSIACYVVYYYWNWIPSDLLKG